MKTWIGPVPPEDDFGRAITDEFVDGRTIMVSRWALMNPESWAVNGCGRLGTGFGQRYRKRDTKWVKVEG